MGSVDMALIASGGFIAGAINGVVGAGTLVTFPLLVLLGYPPLVANVSNAIGLVPGAVSSSIGYRDHVAGQWRRVARWSVASLLGATVGIALLLSLPPGAFEAVVPILVAFSVVLVALQPRIAAKVAERRGGEYTASGAMMAFALGIIGVYSGYFVAGQGVLLLAVLGFLLPEPLQRLNAIKTVLAAVTTALAAGVFALVAPVDWAVVTLVAIGSLAGGYAGARAARLMPPKVLRSCVVAIGATATVALAVRGV